MKITMIGDSAVGKTTFMMSTYGLMRNGLHDFRVKCKDPQADGKLQSAYQRFSRNGTYPEATVQMSSYDYDFYLNDDKVMNFTLTDIRGESIHDYDVSSLERELKSSDAIMLFLSAYDIIHGVDIEDSIDEIKIHLNNCFNVDDDQKLLLVVFTKCDMVGYSDAVMLKLSEAISDLSQMAEANDNILYKAVATACSPDCMMHLDYVMMTLMLVGYQRDVLTKYNAYVKEQEQILALWGKGILRELKYYFFGDAKRNEAIKRAQILTEVELPKLEAMVDKFQKIEKFCEDYKLGTSYTLKRTEDPFDF